MNKYTELSDFEVNKKVAELLLIPHYVIKDKVLNAGSDSVYDPCNNPADAMSIITKNLISLMADVSEDGGSAWWCAQDVSANITTNFKSNPLRAAMEVFLMMRGES